MKAVVKKWGNSAAVRIPAALMEAAHLTLEQVLDVREEGGRLIIEPVEEETVSLEELVAGITDDNRHDDIDFGKPVGQEMAL
ncbi:AbrB/MazE/SpoVT family DNA-binding domain-containing protein [Kordiimonas sp.]|uniref:AbrB/MazE/SpoVT family DNA-binding domain-containing protein n=1 Tax=Kordiimonas sp. TaxID=1970157 RepID=UPI003B524AAF|eukprot:GDKH01021958.1.p4 GENE.GDKH01021958.1~~GDKH01021958.1.p4  ORF type:complete len:82 (+),score=25.31 GDKH01021958.1:61-306(+)